MLILFPKGQKQAIPVETTKKTTCSFLFPKGQKQAIPVETTKRTTRSLLFPKRETDIWTWSNQAKPRLHSPDWFSTKRKTIGDKAIGVVQLQSKLTRINQTQNSNSRYINKLRKKQIVLVSITHLYLVVMFHQRLFAFMSCNALIACMQMIDRQQ